MHERVRFKDYQKAAFFKSFLKFSLETLAERAALHAYVENQAIIEPILLNHVSKGINKQINRAIKTVCELPFYLPM